MLQNSASDQGLHYLLPLISVQNKMKIKEVPRNPLYDEWTRPTDGDGRVKYELKKMTTLNALSLQETYTHSWKD